MLMALSGHPTWLPSKLMYCHALPQCTAGVLPAYCLYVLPAGSQVVFRVRRPAYFINSYMYIEDAEVRTLALLGQPNVDTSCL